MCQNDGFLPLLLSEEGVFEDLNLNQVTHLQGTHLLWMKLTLLKLTIAPSIA